MSDNSSISSSRSNLPAGMSSRSSAFVYLAIPQVDPAESQLDWPATPDEQAAVATLWRALAVGSDTPKTWPRRLVRHSSGNEGRRRKALRSRELIPTVLGRSCSSAHP